MKIKDINKFMDFLNGKKALWVPKQNESQALMHVLHKMKITWASGTNVLKEDNWIKYKEETIYMCLNGENLNLVFGDIQNANKPILKFDEVFERNKMRLNEIFKLEEDIDLIVYSVREKINFVYKNNELFVIQNINGTILKKLATDIYSLKELLEFYFYKHDTFKIVKFEDLLLNQNRIKSFKVIYEEDKNLFYTMSFNSIKDYLKDLSHFRETDIVKNLLNSYYEIEIKGETKC